MPGSAEDLRAGRRESRTQPSSERQWVLAQYLGFHSPISCNPRTFSRPGLPMDAQRSPAPPRTLLSPEVWGATRSGLGGQLRSWARETAFGWSLLSGTCFEQSSLGLRRPHTKKLVPLVQQWNRQRSLQTL